MRPALLSVIYLSINGELWADLLVLVVGGSGLLHELAVGKPLDQFANVTGASEAGNSKCNLPIKIWKSLVVSNLFRWTSSNKFTYLHIVTTTYSREETIVCFLICFSWLPSSIYSWSIGHILEHEFFCLSRLGSQGSKEKKSGFEVFWATFEGGFFNFLRSKIILFKKKKP